MLELQFARGIISSIGWRWETKASIIFEVFRCAIQVMICKCKVSVVYSVNEFLSLLHYFVDNCREANADICETASNLLYELQSDVMQVSHPVASIMGLYSAGLGFVDSDILVRHGDPGIGNSKNASTMIFVTDNDERVEQLVASLGSLSSYFHKDSYGKGIFSSHAEKRGDVHHLAMKSDITHSQSCKHLHGEASLLSYLDAMDFFCSLLVEHVDIAWKLVVTENKDVSFSGTSNCVQDALYQFCDAFCRIFSCKSTSANEREWLRYGRGTLIHSAVAAFKISLGTSKNLQSSMTCIDHLVSRKWIQPLELKFLATSFYNIGVALYNVKQLEQAPVTLKLSCKLLWTNVSVLYQKFSDKSTGTGDDDICESTLIDVITDACGKSANILNILHQCSCPSIGEVISSSLLNWSSAESLLESLPVPMVLVKQWVKIVCKDFGDVSVVDDAPLLFLLLSRSCSTWSKKTMGTILEQELLAYAEMDTRSPNLCQKMQLKIIEILLQEVYVTKEYYFQRSRVLMRQGIVFRACGGDGLQSCLQCLSEAISLLKNISGKTSGSNYALCHQLAITYFLHAQCTQEADQNMEVILDDVNSALKLWFDANITGQCSSVAFPESMIENAVPLLFHAADLLSLLGELQLRGKIHRLIIMLCKWKNVPPEKCLAMFWRDGQLGHTLCASPIDETFIQNFSEQYSIHANDIVVWINSLKDSRPLLLGFFQKFLLSDSISPHVYISDADRCFGSEATVDEIKKAASLLLSGDATGSQSMFIAGCLYYDLSERLFTNGQLFEALSYAKEALRLRTRVLRRKFNYALDRQCAKINGTLETSFNCSSDQVHLEVIGSVIAKIWPDVTPAWNPELSALSPWNVLRCYLESTLQVGTIHESLGNAADAEAHFRVGKQISYLQNGNCTRRSNYGI
ncbi:hypothetical protein QJS04_geneDACA004979 [Acorus gramineus]|uniref:Separase-like second TPR repeats region domain-containing protein n=1 Tax=Acorus gramineus TaxID=55184 RepID=A0AAV9BV29_ACOGR|nr:hypothetical protein QJS04_geneDACA004979 [Acorus gramineus]